MRETLPFVRLMMTFASFAPLFVGLAIKGVPGVPDDHLWYATAAVVALPNAVLRLRVWLARRQRDIVPLHIDEAIDNRDHLLTYLFAVLMPLFQATFGNWRDALEHRTA